ncbi:hypothetical protein HanPI659440_Chr16g0654311 [Helianthus annuus]|nr:hypothetical protein HanPI659440_Chr16g0654311 [Helianthus annuus]
MPIVDEKVIVEMEEGVLENILSGLWFGQTSLEEWVEQILIPRLVDRVIINITGKAPYDRVITLDLYLMRRI